jgi:hypothetical protein
MSAPFQPGDYREPELHRKGDGWLMIRSNGDSYFLDRMWLDGARFAYWLDLAKAWAAYRIVHHFPLGRVGGLRWGLLPSYGDWVYRSEGGRLASLAHFIDADLWKRELVK